MNFTLPLHRLVTLLSVILWAASLVSAQTATKRMTIASAVRLRSAPNLTAPVIDTIAIGVLLDDAEPSGVAQRVNGRKDYWYKVRTPGKKEGWVLGKLTRVVNPKRLDNAYVQLTRERLDLDAHKLEFSDWVDFAAFCNRAAAAVKAGEARGELELGRLRAIQRALSWIPDKERDDVVEPYGSFVDSLGKTVFHDELAHGWFVDPDEYWRLRDRYAALAIGEQIAWVAKDTEPEGECEGYVACYMYWMLKYDGRYLKLYPNGKHTDEVLEGYIKELKEYADPKYLTKDNSDYVDREEIQKILAEVRELVSKSSGKKRAEVLSLLDQAEKIYK